MLEFRAALAIAPDDPQAQYNYAAALHASGEHAQALEFLDRSLLDHPQDAHLHYGRGCLLQSNGHRDEAHAAFSKAVTIRPDHADGWYAIGTLEHAAGDHAAAIECYRNVAALDPNHPAARHLLDALLGNDPPQPPKEFAKTLFDSYADHYDRHITGKLGYRAPQLVERAVREVVGSRSGLQVLDLGCGTGLFGERIRPLADHLVGVDVSPNMLAQAADRGCYDNLVKADLLDYLAAAHRRSFDLIAAVDVFSYMGSLRRAINKAANTLKTGGLLAFSVEAGSGDYTLDQTGRYQHSKTYLATLRSDCGLHQLAFAREVIRHESGKPCEGYIAVWGR